MLESNKMLVFWVVVAFVIGIIGGTVLEFMQLNLTERITPMIFGILMFVLLAMMTGLALVLHDLFANKKEEL